MRAKIFYITILLLISTKACCQILFPGIETNSTNNDSIRIQQLLKITNQYELSLSLMRSCYWFHFTTYYVLARKNDRWSQFKILTDFKDRKGKVIKGKTKIINFKSNQNLCDSIWMKLIGSRLLSMDNDSLNIRNKKLNDSTTISKQIDDGVNYQFVLKAQNSLRIMECYEPESYYQWLPEITVRKYFIECLNIYAKLWKK
jgi:hypothetical protein